MIPKSLITGEYLGVKMRHRHLDGFQITDLVDDCFEQIPVHCHQDGHLCYVARGEYLSLANKERAVITAGTLIYNPPGTVHRDRFLSRDGRFLAISLGPELTDAFRSHMPMSDRAVCLSDVRLSALMSCILMEMSGDDRHSCLALESLVVEIVDRVHGPVGRPVDDVEWLRHAIDLISERMDESISLSEIARTVGVHPVHLTRVFRTRLGLTPADYVRHCRIRQACRMLADSDLAISRIALECGFFDQSHLTRSFKRLTGTTPRRWRKRLHTG